MHIPIEQLVERLCARLGGVRQAFPPAELRMQFENKQYAQMVNTIRRAMRLTNQLTLAKVNSGGKASSPAWIHVPRMMPPFGTREFERTHCVIYIRKDFLRQAPFETVVCAIAHEMAHIVLNSTGNPLRDDERAVDTAVMILGFANYMAFGQIFRLESPTIEGAHVDGALTFWRRLVLRAKSFFVESQEPRPHYRLGYLTREEVIRAYMMLERKM